MVNLRSKSKARAVAPRAALKRESTSSVPSVAPEEDVDLSAAALRKLSRPALQKVAMAHKVKANAKSEHIIRQLLSLQVPRNKRPAEEDREEGPSRKRVKTEATLSQIASSSRPNNQVARRQFSGTGEDATQTNGAAVPSINSPKIPEAGPSDTQPASQVNAPTALAYNQDLFSSTGSEVTEDEQPDYATPVSSRVGTPPKALPGDLRRCVHIMQEIAAKDAALLGEINEVNEITARIRNRARAVRELVKAERARREHMQAYFCYWQAMSARWDRTWFDGEGSTSGAELDVDTGPPTVPVARPVQEGQNGDGQAPPGPFLPPEVIRQRRELIVARQEAEQRELAEFAALQEQDSWGEGSFGEGSSESVNEEVLALPLP